MLEEFHEDILSCQEPDGMDFLFFKKRPHMVQTFLYYFFLFKWCPGQIYSQLLIISGIAFHCPDHLSYLRAFP